MAANFEIRAIPAEVSERLRVRDDAGHRPRWRQQADQPLRCCFRRSRPEETIALVSYAPLRRWAWDTGADPRPYDEVGPVFVHGEDCGGPVGSGFPDDLRGARRVLRAYGADGTILRGVCVESDGRRAAGPVEGPPAIEEEISGLYRDPEVAAVHVRAVEFGCFLLETRRGSDAG